jgi:glutamate decarboxylase
MAVWNKNASREKDLRVVPRFTREGMLEVPKDHLPDREMLPQTAYQIVMDEVMLDAMPGSTSRRS